MDEDTLINGEILCKECGLCCQGVFHPCAKLNDEMDEKFAQSFHAAIKEYSYFEFKVFTLPCPAHNGLCSVYPNRPSVCQKHRCNLLKKINTDEVDLSQALKIVSSIKEIINEILPLLHEHSSDHYYNKPELLMNKILDKHIMENERKIFKEKNLNLFLKYALFLMYRKKYFYN